MKRVGGKGSSLFLSDNNKFGYLATRKEKFGAQPEEPEVEPESELKPFKTFQPSNGE